MSYFSDPTDWSSLRVQVDPKLQVELTPKERKSRNLAERDEWYEGRDIVVTEVLQGKQAYDLSREVKFNGWVVLHCCPSTWGRVLGSSLVCPACVAWNKPIEPPAKKKPGILARMGLA